MTVNLKNPIYQDEAKAREHLESLRWPDGAYCPRCGGFQVVKLGGKAGDLGQYNCRDCRKKFTVTVGTIFERSHIPLTTWLLAFQLMTSSKKGMSAHQLHRMLDVTYKTAWFMAHRIRESMRPTDVRSGPKGGEGKIIEADETYIGGKEKNKHKSKRRHPTGGAGGKQAAFALVERGGHVRSFHVAKISGKDLRPYIVTQVSRKSTLMTDEGGQYRHVGKEFARHETVNHSIDEYVRGDAHTNTVEGYFSILKRGVTGVYHHVSEAHLKRYLCEFDFRYNERAALGVSDDERCAKAIQGSSGKRLTYRRPDGAAHA
ncbi:IS1595 family transposase [Hyphococcus sp.]|jgi:transposase-like protein|uniref:IS1595 family transposase n=1 Tax=Hyphococcus sp. TaxID=2038636 RepID=UPI003D144675